MPTVNCLTPRWWEQKYTRVRIRVKLGRRPIQDILTISSTPMDTILVRSVLRKSNQESFISLAYLFSNLKMADLPGNLLMGTICMETIMPYGSVRDKMDTWSMVMMADSI